MATILSAAVVQSNGLVFGPTGGFGLGLLGMAVVAGAGLIDSQFLYPQLLGSGKQQGRPTSLVGLPTSTSQPGTPRVWAIGRRVRVPLHAIFQSDKEREEQIGGRKGGVAGSIKRVFSDCAFSVNDRPTLRLIQMAANGQLVWWQDRNLVRISTDQMTSSVVSSRLVLTMATAYEPDFSDFLEVGRTVVLVGFSANPTNSHMGTGANAGLSYWRVYAMTPHTATPSTLTLEPLSGQNMGTLVSVTSGSALFPGTVARLDSVFCANDFTCSLTPRGGSLPPYVDLILSDTQKEMMKLATNDIGGWVEVELVNWEYNVGAGWVPLQNGFQASIARPTTSPVSPNYRMVGAWPFGIGDQVRPGSGALGGIVRMRNDNGFMPDMFAASPALSYYPGTAGSDPQGATAQLRGQLEDDIIARHKTSGEIPGFRGLAYQVLDQWDLSTYFGNQLPPIVEGVLEPDAGMTVQQAFVEVVRRADLEDIEIDTEGVRDLPFEGYWVQGAVPTSTALQPLMTAYQVLAQERGHQLALFEMESADVVQIENGGTFSDLGVTGGYGTPNTGDKLRFAQADPADLPHSIGVRHQDPDVQYAVGYQQFAQRQPSGSSTATEQDLDLSNLVLTRKQARNLCATVMRRTWINGTGVDLQLPVAYLEVLENDLLTVTDDEGNDHTVRVIRREVGANFVVNISAVVEDVSLAVSGSPTQRPDFTVPTIPAPLTPVVRVLDMSGLSDADTIVPGYFFGACSPNNGVWNGAAVYESRDSGTTWVQVAVLQSQLGCGTTRTSLATTTDVGEDETGGPYYDTVNTIDIEIDNPGTLGTLLTVTESEVEAGWNWIHVQDGSAWEILGFRDAVDNLDGSFTVSHLLRGLRGTQDSARNETKAGGSTVTFLFMARDQQQMLFRPLPIDSTGTPVTVDVKVLAPGQSLADVTATTVAVNGWNARPFPPFSIDVDRGGSPFNAVLNVLPWSRKVYPIGTVSGFTNDDPVLSLELDIYDPTGVTLQRTKTYTAPAGTDLVGVDFPYPASEQTADGYTPSGSETFIVVPRQVGTFGAGRTRQMEVP